MHHRCSLEQQSIAQNTDRITKLPPELQANIWKPGQSGNPGGRPKRKPLTEALQAILDNPEEVMAVCKAQMKRAKKGHVDSFTAIRDTVEGKPSGDDKSGSNVAVEILISYL